MHCRALIWLVALLIFALAQSSMAAELVTLNVEVLNTEGVPRADAEIVAPNGTHMTVLARTAVNGKASVVVAPGTEIFARYGAERSDAFTGSISAAVQLRLRPTLLARVFIQSATSIVTKRSAAAIVSGSVIGALNFVPNYRSAAEGGSGQISLNGTPLELPPPSAGGARFALPSSLLTSFSPDQADDGTIRPNFHILSPTSTTQVGGMLGVASQDRSLWKTTITGRARTLGYAFAIAGGGDSGVLAGQTFADASGLAYNHSTNTHSLDSSADLEYQVSDVHVSIAGISTRSQGDNITAYRPGTIPAGMGPANGAITSFGSAYLLASRLHGRDYMQFLAVRLAGAVVDNDLNALVGLQPAPSYSAYRFSGHFDEFTFSRNFSATRDLVLKLSSGPDVSAVSQGPAESVSTTHVRTFSASYIRRGAQSSVTLSASAIARTGSFPSSNLNASLSGNVASERSRVSWSLYSANSQTMESYYAGSEQLTTPIAAEFDCSGHRAFIGGSNDVGVTPPRILAVTGNLQQKFARDIDVSLGGFLAVTHHALAHSFDSGTPATISNDYLNKLNQRYQPLCGVGPLTAADVLLAEFHSVPATLGKEWYVSATFPRGPLALTTSYETYSLVALDVPRVLSTSTTLVSGSQLPDIPLHRGSAILAYQQRSLSAAIALQFESSNNAMHLPAYTTVSAGLVRRIGNGTLGLSAQNIFAGRKSLFASSRFAAPLPTTGGPIFLPASPLVPTWTIRYEFGAGSAE